MPQRLKPEKLHGVTIEFTRYTDGRYGDGHPYVIASFTIDGERHTKAGPTKDEVMMDIKDSFEVEFSDRRQWRELDALVRAGKWDSARRKYRMMDTAARDGYIEVHHRKMSVPQRNALVRKLGFEYS